MTFTIAQRIEYLQARLNRLLKEDRSPESDVVSKARERLRKKRILRKKIELLRGVNETILLLPNL